MNIQNVFFWKYRGDFPVAPTSRFHYKINFVPFRLVTSGFFMASERWSSPLCSVNSMVGNARCQCCVPARRHYYIVFEIVQIACAIDRWTNRKCFRVGPRITFRSSRPREIVCFCRPVRRCPVTSDCVIIITSRPFPRGFAMFAELSYFFRGGGARTFWIRRMGCNR